MLTAKKQVEVVTSGERSWREGERNEFIFEKAVFELLPGYPAADVSLRMETKLIGKGQEEERSLIQQIRESRGLLKG